MLKEVAGIQRVDKLYAQLHYLCNFNCQHCFHGERLRLKDAFTYEEAERMFTTFKRDYNISSVTLLGGEPFLHRNITEIIHSAKQQGLKVEICTNGYRIQTPLRRSASEIDNLRVSLEGLEVTNDQNRHPGSFRAAMETLDLARTLGIHTSVTMTVNAHNIFEVIPLTNLLTQYDVRELKLHALRNLGNVLKHQDLIIMDPENYVQLHQQIADNRSCIPLSFLFDEDLDPQCSIFGDGNHTIHEELERIEVQPSGELYVSCKAVGGDSNAFFYNKSSGEISYRPSIRDELQNQIPQVRYSKI